MSEETKWTPGEWVVGGGSHEAPHIITAHDPADGVLFALAGVWGQDDDMEETDMSRANAHLISAAPELYSELASADSQLEMAAEAIEAGRMDEALLHCRSMTRPRRAALAKARGETS